MTNRWMQRSLATVAIAGCLLAGIPAATYAQGLPGLTIFGGPGEGNELRYRLDFGGRANGWDRYRLRIPAKKLNLAAARFTVTYSDNFRGQFDPNRMEVRVKGQRIAMDEVIWDQENKRLEFYPVEPVPAGSPVEIVLSNVKNPSFGGMYYFNAQIETPGDVPLLRYLGTWVITIS